MTALPLPAPTAPEHLRVLALRVEQLPAAGIGLVVVKHVASSLRRYAGALAKSTGIERLRIAGELRLARSVFATSTVKGVGEAWIEASEAVDEWIEQAQRPTLVEVWWHGQGERTLLGRRRDRALCEAAPRLRAPSRGRVRQ